MICKEVKTTVCVFRYKLSKVFKSIATFIIRPISSLFIELPLTIF